MSIDLYYQPASPPCRAVLLTARALNLNINRKLLDLMKGEHLTPEFLKINPQHTIPTLVDDGFALGESRAILAYLANKYGKDGELYPQEARARALVDQRLYFDMGTLQHRFGEYFYPQIFGGAPADAEKLTELEEALKIFDTSLEGQKYAAGASLTIADLSLVATVSSIEEIDVDLNKFPNVQRWYETIKSEAPGYNEANEEGLNAFKELVDEFKKQRKD